MEQLEHDNDAYAALMAGRLMRVREHLGMTQQELADQFGTTQNLIYRLEKGLNVSREMFTLIALYFIRRHKISHEWLFNPEAEEDPSTPMIASEHSKRQRANERQEAERLALLTRFMEDIQKMEKK